MATNRIFLDDNPGQKFTTVLGGVRVVFDFRYNSVTERYYFSMTANDALLLQGRTLETGVDVFKAFPEIAATYGSLIALDIDDRGRAATLGNIAAGDVRVFLVTP